MLFFNLPKRPAAVPSTCECGTIVFFENTACVGCGRLLGYVPETGRIHSFTQDASSGNYRSGDPALKQRHYRACEHRGGVLGCNWMIPTGEPVNQCQSCLLTRTYPDINIPGNDAKWAQAEAAKRRVASQLQRLGIPLVSQLLAPEGVCFDFLQTPPGDAPVITGHENGVITLNVDEADAASRELVRQQLGEEFRTLAGHMRHELAHYYWDLLASDPAWLPAFRERFGDEQVDYGDSLTQYYGGGARLDWNQNCITPYASAHPWEDWAETFAHFLHLHEGVHVARTYGLEGGQLPFAIQKFDLKVLGSRVPKREARLFLEDINAWVKLSLLTNEMSRALGHPNSYPFVLNGPVVEKLWFVRQSIPAIAGHLNAASRVTWSEAA
ncbi:putative zinc-binding metallopeptidase [Verrucomicrobium sp. BvORR106]|uniref:zinc-binding metallopeptidase family protein n=1 Tax=Verrucomicrobium sp. BvORR106 TaxID=1403819 RepID=UPI0006917682|nr:putative zinc-binding metallopeptidase [Verrucomicrobium sp. BvORR106]